MNRQPKNEERAHGFILEARHGDLVPASTSSFLVESQRDGLFQREV